MRHHHRRSRARILAIFAVLAAAYIGILVGVRVIGERVEGPKRQETVGSLEGRFDTNEVALLHLGRRWMYRSADLTNVLLIGMDWEEAHGQTGQADFLLLMTLDRKNRRVHYLQIDADALTPIRTYGSSGEFTGIETARVGLAQTFGEDQKANCGNTVWAVSSLLKDIPIDHFAALDLEGIAALNDALGGVKLTLEEDLSALDAQMTKGAALTLTAQQAQRLVSERLDGDTSEARMRRQQVYVRSAMDMAAQNVSNAAAAFGAIAPQLVTDMEYGKLMNLLYTCRSYEQTDVCQIAGQHGLDQYGAAAFQVDEAALRAFIAETYCEQEG